MTNSKNMMTNGKRECLGFQNNLLSLQRSEKIYFRELNEQ
ncbi:hypothetical protein HMPREF2532_03324 [Bacteroides ovatus]|nr:hypothetical protein HMPREF2532_03324 [Bacteroides ovatus]CAG9870087.1 hypothetical protein BOVAC1_4442 [Bacteroides ovatus]CAG9886821.1 hypothetical protein BOVA711_3645 [Bacteroides ovatus]CAG9893640.1 hypothetical protein BOVA514_2753 [Bacteroides ovatus]CAG9911082.1 hypothetical protein BOVA435_1152 [Bacteroides ovatus]